MSLSGPTLSGYQAWLVQNGFSNSVLPSNSPFIGYSYDVALELVNKQILTASPTMYTLAVYNLAASNLLLWCPDVQDSSFFADLRAKWNTNNFISGVVQSSGDEGTNESMLVPEQMKEFTLANLQQLKDQYGRTYLAIAQSVGTLWGLS